MAQPAQIAAELLRNAHQSLPDGGLAAKLALAEKEGRQLRVKLGLDPTAPDIHIGHTVVLNKMRLHPDTTRIPVILASTTTQLLRDNEANFRAKGCDILPKPFDLEELLTIVGKYVPPQPSA